jgi:proteasome accessory factor C
MSRADDRLQRLLQVFPLMADEPQLSLDALAVRIGTDARTLRRDFHSLERDDVPAGFIEAIQVEIGTAGASMRSAHFKRPQRLTRPELVALELGLGMLEQELPVDERAVVQEARRRLQQVSVPVVATVAGQRRGTESGGGSAGGGTPVLEVEPARPRELGTLATVHRALEQGVVVTLAYQRPDEAAATERRVRPYALVRADANVYLVAHCERAEALRVFRLDRVATAALTDDAFTVPADFRVEQVLQPGRVFQHDDDRTPTLRIRYSPRVARWIAEREGVPCDADGGLEVAYPLADDGWAVRHVLQYGPDAVIVAPDAVRARVLALLETLDHG